MAFFHLQKKSFKFLITTFFISPICFLTSCKASQLNNLPQESYLKQIRVGIRTTSSAIGSKRKDGSYGGFCGEFLKTLEHELSRQNLQIPVISKDIANQYRGKAYPKYGGLIAEKIEIECGPNSRSLLKLRDRRDNQLLKSKIKFSKKSFHTTGIKLLLKKETAAELENTPRNQLEKKLSALPIAVIRGTTTLKQFEKNANYYDGYVPYPKIKQKNQKLDIRDLALNDLEKGEIKAFASDAIILRTLLEEGIEGKSGYRKSRQPFKKDNYVIYPQEAEKYLPKLQKQRYAIAINKNTDYAKWLRETVDKVLEKPSLNQAKQDIQKYENGGDISPPVPQTPLNQPPREQPSKSDRGNNPFFDPGVIAAFITAVSTILVGYWQYGRRNKAKSG
ncbi:MAG: transporter substrate-binding domain-containing protein [Cyanobacteriota bacterium]|nr:transporter substrate-binding domain-containing protein [Cyanobacteriota bacterium]